MHSTYGVMETINRSQSPKLNLHNLRGVRIRIFAVLGSSHHIFQWIGTKFRTKLKLSNSNFVLSGKWDRKYKSDFRDVRIPVSVSISALGNDYAHNSLRIFTKFCTLLGCGQLDVCCFYEKLELDF